MEEQSNEDRKRVSSMIDINISTANKRFSGRDDFNPSSEAEVVKN